MSESDYLGQLDELPLPHPNLLKVLKGIRYAKLLRNVKISFEHTAKAALY